MERVCASASEKLLGGVELGREKWFEPEAEGLGEGRRRAVEHRVRAGDVDPGGAEVGLELAAGVDVRGVGCRLRAFHPPREF